MSALLKFLVRSAIFLLASNANAFTSLSSVAGNQTTNQRLEWNAELPDILSQKRGKYSLSQKQDAELPNKITISTTQVTSNTSYKFEAVNNVDSPHDNTRVTNKRVTFSDERDNEIHSKSPTTSNSRPFCSSWRVPRPSDWQGPKQQSFNVSARVPFPKSFRSYLSSGLNCWVHSHTGFESVTSSKKVSFSVFTLLAFI